MNQVQAQTTSPVLPRSATPIAQPALELCELVDPGLPSIESFSPFCMKAHRAMRVLGLRYERRYAMDPGSHKAHNPTGQVPVLLVGGEAVADSTEILRKLDALFPGRLVPTDRRAASEAWLWEELGDTTLNGFLVAARWADDENWPLVEEAYFGAVPRPIRWILPGRLRAKVLDALHARDVWRRGGEACWARFERTLDELEARAPATGFWLGARLTVADLGLFPQLHGLRTPLTARQAVMVARRPALSAWLDRVDQATST